MAETSKAPGLLRQTAVGIGAASLAGLGVVLLAELARLDLGSIALVAAGAIAASVILLIIGGPRAELRQRFEDRPWLYVGIPVVVTAGMAFGLWLQIS